MPECTPQKGNLVFRGENFKVRRVRNSVQGIPLGFRLIRAGRQITHRDCVLAMVGTVLAFFVAIFIWSASRCTADLLDARQAGILTLTREKTATWSAGLSR